MDGRVGVEGTPGVGSNFWVELPLAVESDTDPTERNFSPTDAIFIESAHRALY